jgi:predicted nucleotidyltransferase
MKRGPDHPNENRGGEDMDEVDAVSLPSRFLERLTSELWNPRTVAVALVGSHSRGVATADSDIDLTQVVDEPVADTEERVGLRMRDGWLVSVVTTTVADLTHAFAQPDRAVWTVPALRDARILYDPAGRLAHLQQEAAAFQWEPLQAAADAYASGRLLKFAEEAQSLLGAVRRGDSAQILTATTWLVVGLPLVVAVQRGILLLNETRAPLQVQRAVGDTSLWSRSYRIAAGVEPDQTGQPSVGARGKAGLQLYGATVELLRPALQPAQVDVIDTVLAHVRRAGYAEGASTQNEVG